MPLLEGGRAVLWPNPSRAARPAALRGLGHGWLRGRRGGSGRAFTVIGEAPRARFRPARSAAGEAVRIFTGAPVPPARDRVVIQEDVTRDGDRITLTGGLETAEHPPGRRRFRAQAIRYRRAARLGPQDVALLAAMNIARSRGTARPVVALIATGDELVMPGEAPGPDQIIASNTFGLHACSQAGAAPRLLPIARDTRASACGRPSILPPAPTSS